MDAQHLPGGLVIPRDPDALRALCGILPFPVSVREIITDDAGNPYDYRIIHHNQAYADFILPVLYGTLDGRRTLRECLPECDERLIEHSGRVALGPDKPGFEEAAFSSRGKTYRSFFCKVRHGITACMFIPVATPDESESVKQLVDRKYQTLVEKAIDYYLLLDENQNVADFSESLLNELRVLRNVRLNKTDIIGCHLHTLFPSGSIPEGPFTAMADAIRKGEQHWINDYVLVHPETGKERCFNIQSFAIHQGTAVTAIEITSRYEAERNLRQADKMRSLGLLAGGIAHDFNNMLTGIKTFSQILERQVKAGSRQHDCVKHILESGERAADLTRQLLSFARQGDFNRQPENMHAVLKDVVSLLKHSADRKIRFITDFSAAKHTIPVNRTQIHNAFLNIALNAADALDDTGDITFATADTGIKEEQYSKFDNQDTVPGKYLTVTITDTGCGMPEAVIERLFEPFFTTKKGEKGTGMGLAIVFGTVRVHKGRIDVASEPGKGTVVKVSLPVPDTGQEVIEASYAAAQPLRDMRILIIDDEQSVRLSLQEALAECRGTLTVCRDGDEGIAAVAAAPAGFDLLLLDMVMPGLDGLDTLRGIREYAPDLPVIILSGYSDENRKKDALAEGVSAFVTKPFDIDVLISAVRQALL